jgi:hypothetical protein
MTYRNDDMNYQRKDHPVPEAIEKVIRLTEIADLGLSRLNPIRTFKIMLCDRIINRHFAEEIKNRYKEYLSNSERRSQSIMYVVIRYLAS